MKKMIEDKFKAEAKASQVSGLKNVAENARSGYVSGTAGEAIAMKKMIEGKFRADARARQAAAGGDVSQKRNACDQVIISGDAGPSREKIAKAIGIGSSASMDRAERVVENGIPELVEAMDSGELDGRGRDP